MKVVYEPNEIQKINKVYEEMPEMRLFRNTEDVYALRFKATNPALASYILCALLHDYFDDFDIGINVTEIILRDQPIILPELKDKMHRFIDGL